MKDISPQSGRENEFVAKSFRDRASSFKERFKVGFGSLLKAQGGFAPVASVCMTARQQRGFGDPYAVFIPSKLHF
jgi:hypothetical protein